MLTLVVLAVLCLPVSYFTILIHELGHYIACRLQKITPIQVNIGSGPTWYKFQRKGTWFHFNRWPSIGSVTIAPGHIKKIGLSGTILVLIAGPCCHFVASFSLIALSTVSILPESLQMALWWLGFIEALTAFGQLIPWRRYIKNGDTRMEMRSDGFQIRNMWRRRHQFKIVNENW